MYLRHIQRFEELERKLSKFVAKSFVVEMCIISTFCEMNKFSGSWLLHWYNDDDDDDHFAGFLDAQIRKDGIKVNDDVENDDNYDVLAPHEINQLEVSYRSFFYSR